MARIIAILEVVNKPRPDDSEYAESAVFAMEEIVHRGDEYEWVVRVVSADWSS